MDDHLGTLRVMQRVLRGLGCDSDLAEDGQQALEAVRAREYDVVFMDVVMPRMDGIAATLQIRKERPFDAGLRIVGMSADTTPEDQETCFAVGMDSFLSKPIDVELMTRILDEAALRFEAAVC